MRRGNKSLKLNNNKTPDSFLVKYRRCLWEILHLSRRSEMMMRGNRRVKPQWAPPPVGSPDWTLLLALSIKILSLRLNTHIYSTDYTYSPFWNGLCTGVKTLFGMAYIKGFISNARLWNPAGHQKLSLAAKSDLRGHCMEMNTLI